MGLLKRLFGREEADWQAPGSPVKPSGGPLVQSQNVVLTGNEAREALEGIERATGMDLDGDGRGAGGAGAAPMIPVAPQGDVVSQLERLAALRASGALTEEEFAAQKARLLGGPAG